MAIVASPDYGEDEPSAQALLQRHRDLQGELNAYNGDVQSLNAQADRLIKSGISTLPVRTFPLLLHHQPFDSNHKLERWDFTPVVVNLPTVAKPNSPYALVCR